MPENKVVVVFTSKSIERILREGGTCCWRLDRNNARQCEYAVCTRNAKSDWVEGDEEHHAAFLVGRIKDVVASPFNDDRFLILFSEYALVTVPEVWKGHRSPVKYEDTLDQFGIDPDALAWQTMPEPAEVETEEESEDEPAGLTIAQAKKGLALTFGVKPEAIEITIRG
jgi:hypothetical protein